MTDGGEDTFFASGFASAGLVESAFAAATLGSGFASSRRRGVSSFFSSSFDSFASGAAPKTSFAGPRPVLAGAAPQLPVRLPPERVLVHGVFVPEHAARELWGGEAAGSAWGL